MRTRAKFSFLQDNILIISLEIKKKLIYCSKVIISNHKVIMITLQCNL